MGHGHVREFAELQDEYKLLGAELLTGEFADGELADTTEARRKLIAIYRQFRPTLVLAHAPVDYHPDHRAASAPYPTGIEAHPP